MRRLAVVCAVAVFAGACSPAGESTPPPTSLSLAVRSIGSLDPLAAGAVANTGGEPLVARQIFEGLTAYDPKNLKPQPALATSWQVGSDGRTWSFLLRKGARFHSGREVTASDVLFSLNRLARAACSPDEAITAGAPSYLLSLVVGYSDVAGACKSDTLAGITAVGESTVMISLSQPWADFASVLAAPAASILPADGLSDEPAFGRLPIGTGPYRVTKPWDGTEIELKAFGDYWGAKPTISEVTMNAYRDDSMAYLDLLRGRVSVAPVPAGRVRDARRRFGETGFVPTVGLYFFGVNLRSPRMAPLAFREGLSMAANRGAIATAVYENTRDAAGGLTSTAMPLGGKADCAKICTHDAAAARSKIQEAYGDTPPEVVVGISDDGSNPGVADGLVRSFASAGVTARVVARPLAEHLKGIQAGDVDLFQFGWIPPFPAPDALLNPLFRTASRDNFMTYSNPDVDATLAKARETLDDTQRAKEFAAAETRILADVPVIPLLWFRSSLAFDKRLTARGGPLVDGLGLVDASRLVFSGS